MKRLPLVAAEAAARLTLGSSSGTSAPRLGRDALAAAQSVVVSSINKPILTVLTTRTAPRRPRLRGISSGKFIGVSSFASATILSFLKKNVVFSSDAATEPPVDAPSETDVLRFSLFSVDAPDDINENPEFSDFSSVSPPRNAKRRRPFAEPRRFRLPLT